MFKQPGPRLRPAVLAARERLADGRAKIKAQHERGSPGIQVCTHLAALLDSVLLDLYQSALGATEENLDSVVALAPVGGFGRRDVAPYSDVDLMLLHRPGCDAQVASFVRIFTQDICDAGLQLGFSLRTPAQACSLAVQDATIFTALTEARLLAGSVPLFDVFERSFRPPGAAAASRSDESDRGSTPRGASPVRRDGLSAGAERQTLQRGPARVASAALGRVCPLRRP